LGLWENTGEQITERYSEKFFYILRSNISQKEKTHDERSKRIRERVQWVVPITKGGFTCSQITREVEKKLREFT